MYNALKLKFPGQNIMWKSVDWKIHERRTTSEWIMHSPKAQQHTALGSSPNSINSEKTERLLFFHTRSRLYGVELCALPLVKWAVNIDFLLGRFTVTCYTFRGNVSLVEWKRNHRGGDDAADALVKISLFRRYTWQKPKYPKKKESYQNWTRSVFNHWNLLFAIGHDSDCAAADSRLIRKMKTHSTLARSRVLGCEKCVYDEINTQRSRRWR